MTVPLTRELITFLNADPDKAAVLRYIATNLSPEDQAKLRQIAAYGANTAGALQYISANIPATPKPAAAPTKVPVQVNEAQYAQQKSDINNQYGAQLAASDYSRAIAQQRGSRALGDFNVSAQQQREHFDNPYLQRGLFNSGIRREGLDQMRAQQASQYGQLVDTNNQALTTIANQRALLQQQQQGALNAVDRARQQALAAQLAKLGS